MESDKIYTEYKQTSNYSNDKILVLSQLNNSDICKQLFYMSRRDGRSSLACVSLILVSRDQQIEHLLHKISQVRLPTKHIVMLVQQPACNKQSSSKISGFLEEIRIKIYI